jgi:hypothetical protein
MELAIFIAYYFAQWAITLIKADKEWNKEKMEMQLMWIWMDHFNHTNLKFLFTKQPRLE